MTDQIIDTTATIPANGNGPAQVIGAPMPAVNYQGNTPAAVLQQQIDAGAARSQETVNRILRQDIESAIVPSKAFQFDAESFEREDGKTDARLMLSTSAGHTWSMHRNALSQMCGRVRLPVKYSDTLTEAGALQERRTELLAHNLRELFAMTGGRFLVRAVDGEARGFLSDRYKVLDGHGLIAQFCESSMAAGLVPFRGVWTDLRYGLTFVAPRVFELDGGKDAIALGVQVKHSEFGAGAFDVSMFILRLLCTNGMTGTNTLRKVHAGRILDEDFAWSQKTIAAESETLKLALGDGLKSIVGQDHIEKTVEAIDRMASSQMDWGKVKATLRKKLLKSEMEAVSKLYEGNDVVDLPSGATSWRLANCLSLLARDGKVGDKPISDDRKLDLERWAGELIKLPAPKVA